MSLPDLVSTKVAAEILKMKQESVARLCRSGKLNAERVGWGWVIARTSVEAYGRRVSPSES